MSLLKLLQRKSLTLALVAMVPMSSSCAQTETEPEPQTKTDMQTQTAPQAQDQAQPETPVEPQSAPAPAEGWKVETVAEGIRQPWGMTWLPDGRLLLTAKHGTLHVWSDGKLQGIPMEGLPQVFTGGQGGLLDIALHPKFAANRYIYMTMSTGSSDQNRTTLVRGTFDGERVTGIKTLFQVEPTKSGGQHFGSRLLWLPDGTLLMSIGDGGNPPLRVDGMLAREQAQNLGSHLGSIVRLTADGKAAPDNPLAQRDGALPEIWSYGHRNIQGMTRDPKTGRIWASEHGPRGGDEINLVEVGKNYGWPVVTRGRDYRTRQEIGKDSAEGMVEPRVIWSPSPAPSGLTYYTGSHFPNWQGSLFSGGLASHDIRRVQLDEQGNVVGQNRIDIGSRVRDVKQGPDGHLYAITDERNGKLLRIVPE